MHGCCSNTATYFVIPFTHSRNAVLEFPAALTQEGQLVKGNTITQHPYRTHSVAKKKKQTNICRMQLDAYSRLQHQGAVKTYPGLHKKKTTTTTILRSPVTTCFDSAANDWHRSFALQSSMHASTHIDAVAEALFDLVDEAIDDTLVFRQTCVDNKLAMRGGRRRFTEWYTRAPIPYGSSKLYSMLLG